MVDSNITSSWWAAMSHAEVQQRPFADSSVTVHPFLASPCNQQNHPSQSEKCHIHKHSQGDAENGLKLGLLQRMKGFPKCADQRSTGCQPAWHAHTASYYGSTMIA
jgi:hypothetical protein